MNNTPVFTSPLKELLEEYVNHRRMRGYTAPSSEEDIRQFDVYAADSSIASKKLTKELVEAYIARRSGEKPATQIHRVSTVRCFGKYLARRGIDAYVLPNGGITVDKYYFMPHILSRDEVARLILAADSMPYHAVSPKRHLVVPMMFRVIYACGLRISEAINLTVEDIDLNTGVILIRAAKFNKDRYVPIASSLLQRCQIYVSSASLSDDVNSPFFPSPTNSFYHRISIGYVFRQLLSISDIPHTDDGPTVHSLRHSFAVHNLARWGRDGKDINAMLPYLSAYMGHDNLLGTERYLRMTAEMFPELRERIRTGCSWIMPEVNLDES